MLKPFLLTTVLGVGVISSASEYPVMINCVNPNDARQKLQLGINFLKNNATLIYEAPELENPAGVRVGPATGPQTHASINLENYAGGGLTKHQTLTFYGTESMATRVLHYSNFKLKLAYNGRDSYVPMELSYSSGIDAFPDTVLAKEFKNLPMSCTIQGL